MGAEHSGGDEVSSRHQETNSGRQSLQQAGNNRAMGMRPGSATVAGQAGRFLSNQQSKRKYAERGPGQNMGGLDQITHTYQQ